MRRAAVYAYKPKGLFCLRLLEVSVGLGDEIPRNLQTAGNPRKNASICAKLPCG